MSILTPFIQVYLVLLAVVIWHEIGHFSKRIRIIQFIPWPEGEAYEAKYRYGGLIFNVIGFVGIFLLKPESMWLILFGLFNWVHFILYSIFGSITPEINWPRWMWGNVVFDDIPNELGVLFIPAAILAFFIFKGFYLPVLLASIPALFLVGYIILRSLDKLRRN